MFAPKDDRELYGLYCWNESLSQCFHTLLAIIEVTLRNGMHAGFSTAQAGLPNHHHVHWYEHVKLQSKSEKKVKEITHRWIKGNQIARFPPTSPNDVIASLTFGFWKHLLDVTQYHDQTPVNIAQILSWVFPYHPSSSIHYWSKLKWQDRLFSRLDLVADIRNRIAHLEPIWKFGDLLAETRPRQNAPQAVAQLAPTTPPQVLARLTLVLNRSIELLSWLSTHRASDFRDSISHRKLRYLITMDAIDNFKNLKGNRTINKFGLYKIIQAKKPVDGILHFNHQKIPPVIIMPWVM